MIKNKKSQISALLIILSCLVSGCASVGTASNYSNRSVVYGYIDMSEAPTELHWLHIIQTKPEKFMVMSNEAAIAKIGNGYVFYHYGIPPGTHHVWKFGGSNMFLKIFSGPTVEYKVPDNSGIIFNTNKKDVYFLGAYKYKEEKSTGKFYLSPTSLPGKKADLLALLRSRCPPSQALCNKL